MSLSKNVGFDVIPEMLPHDKQFDAYIIYQEDLPMQFVNQPELIFKDDTNIQESNEKDSMCKRLKCQQADERKDDHFTKCFYRIKNVKTRC